MKIPWKDVFCRYFLLFVLQLSWFKTYPHADAKQKKTKKWPNLKKNHPQFTWGGQFWSFDWYCISLLTDNVFLLDWHCPYMWYCYCHLKVPLSRTKLTTIKCFSLHSYKHDKWNLIHVFRKFIFSVLLTRTSHGTLYLTFKHWSRDDSQL
jgi:hypothetical protein